MVALVIHVSTVAVVFTVVFTEARSPILIVPGLTGSQLFKQNSKSNIWKGLWLGADICLDVQSTLNDLSLVFNPATGTFQNQSGVGIQAFGFGDTCKTEYMIANPIYLECPAQVPLVQYFHTMVKHFVELGYERGVTIRAAPYDWRLAEDQLQTSGYYASVQSLVETMYTAGGNAKVTIVAHSLGGPVSLFFLNNVVTQQWKNTYINAFIPIAGAWSGGNAALESVISGLQINSIYLFLEKLCYNLPPSLQLGITTTTRTFPSVSTLLPKPSVWTDTVLVTTPERNYTANDYEALFADMNYTQGFVMYKNTSKINAGFPSPNISVYCFYGTEVPTAEKFIYDSGFPDTAPEIVNGDGDGIVNLQSSKVCLNWAKQGLPFKSMDFPGATHTSILSDIRVLSAIDAVVLNGCMSNSKESISFGATLFAILLICSSV